MEELCHEIYFNVSPEVLYDTLMDEKKHAAFTDSEVSMDPKAGGKFSVFDGYITGKNLQLVPGKKIVQSWKAIEDGWPDDHFSQISFTIEPEKKGCRLIFEHTDIPDGLKDRFDEGWKEHYWERLKDYFEKQ